MPRIVPSQVVATIDKYLPWAKDSRGSTEGNERRARASQAAVYWLSGIVNLLDQVPDELLIFKTVEASEFLLARTALRRAAELVVPDHRTVKWPMLHEHDCVQIVRTALKESPDQAPSTSGGGLTFITDSDWRNSLLTDLGEVERALANSEWKSATVLGGSILESLLLWAVNKRSADVPAAKASAVKKNLLRQLPSGPPEKWDLYELSEIAFELKEITENTVNTVRPGRHFRNLIHPGLAQRTGDRCDRGIAYTTYGAIFNVVRDLRPC
jgi:hypothetical protein